MKKLLISACLALSLALPVIASTETVHKVIANGQCNVLVVTYYEYSGDTTTVQYSCAAWDAIVAQREAEAEEKLRQENWGELRDSETKSGFQYLEEKGLRSVMDEIAKSDTEYKHYPDKTAKALNRLFMMDSKVTEWHDHFLVLRDFNPYASRFIFNLFDALDTMQSKGYGSAEMDPWEYKIARDPCGKKQAIFFTTVTHNKKRLKFGVASMEYLGYISEAEINAGKLSKCMFD